MIIARSTFFAFLSVINFQKSTCMSISTGRVRVIDSHLHVWASKDESATYPYAEGQDPPTSLASVASTSELLKKMDQGGVSGALIVQPINHRFDHSYVINAIKSHPDRFKGMLLHDPSLPEYQAVSRLEELALNGFVGVRFNPYLWPRIGEKSWEPMSAGAGLATYKRCAELKMPVGVMCFQGLKLHYDDILELLKLSPETTLVLDHFAFTSLSETGNESFRMLVKLANHPQVYVKISALFRQGDTFPYALVLKERLKVLLEAFGPERLMFGTDFPFVLEQKEQYGGTIDLVTSWFGEDENARASVMGGTAENVFGAWGTKKD